MTARNCHGCRDGTAFTLPITMAFQPIVDLATGEVFAHEALVRGVAGEGAGHVLAAVDASNLYAFDQQCRVKAIELASRLGLADDGACLSINFLPKAVYEPRACIRLTLATAERTGFPPDRIIFEFTENEEIDAPHLLSILQHYRSLGFKTAIDDFGAGHAGLNLLTRFQPDIVKIDMELIRGIDGDRVKRTVMRHLIRMLEEIEVLALCEGVETRAELAALEDLGVRLVQGYLIARPAFEALAVPAVPERAGRAPVGDSPAR
jgi:EAL domain-containing protein (putative c-di-GMP-specific phosphodiesterase class I)